MTQIDTTFDIGAAQRHWFTRPADQRFETLDALHTSIAGRTARAMDYTLDLGEEVTAIPQHLVTSNPEPEDRALAILSKKGELVPTHWAFGQLCQRIKAPASYLRTLPASLATKLLNHGFKGGIDEELRKGRFLADADPECERPTVLRAVTSETYGRIWDKDVVELAQRIVQRSDGVLHNPIDWSKKGSGLFASDRDVFIFLVDGGSIVNGGGDRDQLHRGIYLWNSECGKTTFGVDLFYFRLVCGNLGLMGVEQAVSLRIRHTSQAPARFEGEAWPQVQDWMQSSVKPMESLIQQAKHFELPSEPEKRLEFLLENKHMKRVGLTRGEFKSAIAYAEREEGQCGNLWDLHNGLTAYARDLAHVDARVEVSRKAGVILKLAA